MKRGYPLRFWRRLCVGVLLAAYPGTGRAVKVLAPMSDKISFTDEAIAAMAEGKRCASCMNNPAMQSCCRICNGTGTPSAMFTLLEVPGYTALTALRCPLCFRGGETAFILTTNERCPGCSGTHYALHYALNFLPLFEQLNARVVRALQGDGAPDGETLRPVIVPPFMTTIVCPICKGDGKMWVRAPFGSRCGSRSPAARRQVIARVGHIMSKRIDCTLCLGRKGLSVFCPPSELQDQFKWDYKAFQRAHRRDTPFGEAFVPAEVLKAAKPKARARAKALFGKPCRTCHGIGIIACKNCQSRGFTACPDKRCDKGWDSSRAQVTECSTCHGSTFVPCAACHGMRATFCKSCRGAGMKR